MEPTDDLAQRPVLDCDPGQHFVRRCDAVVTAFVDKQEPSHEDSLQQVEARSRVKACEHVVTESKSCHARKWLVRVRMPAIAVNRHGTDTAPSINYSCSRVSTHFRVGLSAVT